MQACGRVFSYSAAPTRQSRLFPLRITMMRQLLNVVTRQYSVHCVSTLGCMRRVKRLSFLLCRMLANTGFIVAMSWLYSFLPLGLSMAHFMRTVN